MKYEDWKVLSTEMAIEGVVIELADMMIPVTEGRCLAIEVQQQNTQDWQNMVYNMGLALIVLEKLGYTISK